MPNRQFEDSRWFPTRNQLENPDKLMSTLRQVLQQHYALVDQFDAYRKAHPPAQSSTSGPPPGSGPTDSMLCGLFVTPVDVQALADGATLKFVKKNGNFTFS